MTKLAAVLVVVLVIIGASAWWKTSSSVHVTSQEDNLKSTENGEATQTYITENYKFRFSYLSHWRLVDNRLGAGYGTLAFVNIPEGQVTGEQFSEGENLIDLSIEPNTSSDYVKYILSHAATITETSIDGQRAQRVQSTLNWLGYLITLPSVPNGYLIAVISGDSANFSELDNILKTLTWL
jgi:hypothetical protein